MNIYVNQPASTLKQVEEPPSISRIVIEEILNRSIWLTMSQTNWREVTQSLDIITHSHSPIVLNNTDNFRLYSQVKEEEERDNKMSFSVKWRKLPSKIKVELFPVKFLFNRIIFYVIKEISLDSVFSCIEGLNFSYNYRLLLGFSNITTGNSIFTWIK